MEHRKICHETQQDYRICRRDVFRVPIGRVQIHDQATRHKVNSTFEVGLVPGSGKLWKCVSMSIKAA